MGLITSRPILARTAYYALVIEAKAKATQSIRRRSPELFNHSERWFCLRWCLVFSRKD